MQQYQGIPGPYMQSGVRPVINAQTNTQPIPIPPQQQQQQDQQLTQAVTDLVSNLPPDIQKLLSTINPNTFNQALSILNQIADEVLNTNIQS